MKYFFSSLLLLIGSCTPLEFYDIAKEFVDGTKKCDGTTNQKEYQEIGIYRDSYEKEYQAIVDYENIEDRLYENLSASDMAQIASIAIDTLKKENYKSTNDLYQFEFSKFHIVVTHTDEEFAYLYDGDKFEKDKDSAINELEKIAAYVNVTKQCWDSTDSNFTIVVRNHELDVETIVHELGHIIAYYEFGDSDGNHNNPKIWYYINGFDSINGKIMWNYEEITGIDIVEGGPSEAQKSSFLF